MMTERKIFSFCVTLTPTVGGKTSESNQSESFKRLAEMNA